LVVDLVGCTVAEVGNTVDWVGNTVGDLVGTEVDLVGIVVARGERVVGMIEGSKVGDFEENTVGTRVGYLDGSNVGLSDG